MKKKGIFVTIDGANGSGKSTLLSKIIERLNSLNFDSMLTKEPTNSQLGEFIRKEQQTIKGKSLACLVSADRYQHIENIILPNLNEGKIVISDRYIASSLVYQIIDGLTYDFVWLLNSEILKPDLTIILNVNKQTLINRLKEREYLTRFENIANKQKEIELYSKAILFLKEKSFNIIELDNDNCTIDENVKKVVSLIIQIVHQ